jgi:hypothetical protein
MFWLYKKLSSGTTKVYAERALVYCRIRNSLLEEASLLLLCFGKTETNIR